MESKCRWQTARWMKESTECPRVYGDGHTSCITIWIALVATRAVLLYVLQRWPHKLYYYMYCIGGHTSCITLCIAVVATQVVLLYVLYRWPHKLYYYMYCSGGYTSCITIYYSGGHTSCITTYYSGGNTSCITTCQGGGYATVLLRVKVVATQLYYYVLRWWLRSCITTSYGSNTTIIY